MATDAATIRMERLNLIHHDACYITIKRFQKHLEGLLQRNYPAKGEHGHVKAISEEINYYLNRIIDEEYESLMFPRGLENKSDEEKFLYSQCKERLTTCLDSVKDHLETALEATSFERLFKPFPYYSEWLDIFHLKVNRLLRCVEVHASGAPRDILLQVLPSTGGEFTNEKGPIETRYKGLHEVYLQHLKDVVLDRRSKMRQLRQRNLERVAGVRVEPVTWYHYYFGFDTPDFVRTDQALCRDLSTLKPFVCTFHDCEEWRTVYKSKNEWRAHEVECHGDFWACSLQHVASNDKCVDTRFKTCEELMEHIEQRGIAGNQRSNEKSIDDTTESRSCVFCGEKFGRAVGGLDRFTDHMEEHMLHLTQLSLAYDIREWEESDPPRLRDFLATS